MTDTESPPVSLPPVDPAAKERAARQRFFAIGLFRLSGALILVFGIAISQQHFGWVMGQKAKIMGMIVATVGFIQMMVIPRMLIRAFVTPKLPVEKDAA
jgi:hypothetical protein